MAKSTKKVNLSKIKKSPSLTEVDLTPYKNALKRKGYDWLEYLGTGNWGEVYKVRHNELDCMRAVKILLPKHLGNKQVKKRFLGEAKKMVALRHNHIVNILDLGIPNGRPYYVMEYIEKNDLDELLSKHNDLGRDEYLQILKQICDVLNYIHDNGIIHLDIKAANVLVERNFSAGGIKLADFGLAHSVTSKGKHYIVNPDITWMPKSLRDNRNKKVTANTFKPVHDLAYLGRMLKDLKFDTHVANVWSDRQLTILKKLVDDLEEERIYSARQLDLKLAKLSPSHPPADGVPELAAAHAVDSSDTIRIPAKNIVPITDRIRKLVDLPEFQRLRRIKQLGPTSLVYPGASHTRFEHSLGSYTLAIEYLSHLLGVPQFDYLFEPKDLCTLLVAVLLHDIGHYPFAHQLAELHDNRFPDHRSLSRDLLCGITTLAKRPKGLPTLQEVLKNNFNLVPDDVAKLIKHTHGSPSLTNEQKILASFLDSALDVDKLDYLMRDSIHCGVEYAQHIDRLRLLRSLTISTVRNELAVTEKGKMAVEYMIMGRSAMFSEVYWHHTNRAATVMLQRAFLEVLKNKKFKKEELLQKFLQMGDEEALYFLVKNGPKYITELVPSLPPWSLRQVYKRLLTFARHYTEDYKFQIYDKLIELNNYGKQRIEKALVRLIGKKHPTLRIRDHEILLDIPSGDKSLPPVQIVYPSMNAEISLRSITHFSESIFDQFFKHTKKARVFCSPRLQPLLLADRNAILNEIARNVDVALPKEKLMFTP